MFFHQKLQKTIKFWHAIPNSQIAETLSSFIFSVFICMEDVFNLLVKKLDHFNFKHLVLDFFFEILVIFFCLITILVPAARKKCLFCVFFYKYLLFDGRQHLTYWRVLHFGNNAPHVLDLGRTRDLTGTFVLHRLEDALALTFHLWTAIVFLASRNRIQNFITGLRLLIFYLIKIMAAGSSWKQKSRYKLAEVAGVSPFQCMSALALILFVLPFVLLECYLHRESYFFNIKL